MPVVASGSNKSLRAIMTIDMTNYLRALAQTCIRLARSCPDRATAHGLEELAADLMKKVEELEELYGP
jgi:hypothetical protein